MKIINIQQILLVSLLYTKLLTHVYEENFLIKMEKLFRNIFSFMMFVYLATQSSERYYIKDLEYAESMYFF